MDFPLDEWVGQPGVIHRTFCMRREPKILTTTTPSTVVMNWSLEVDCRESINRSEVESVKVMEAPNWTFGSLLAQVEDSEYCRIASAIMDILICNQGQIVNEGNYSPSGLVC